MLVTLIKLIIFIVDTIQYNTVNDEIDVIAVRKYLYHKKKRRKKLRILPGEVHKLDLYIRN